MSLSCTVELSQSLTKTNLKMMLSALILRFLQAYSLRQKYICKKDTYSRRIEKFMTFENYEVP